MPQISTVGPSGCDYSSLAAWWAAEKAVDYGGTLEAVITGACVGDSGTLVQLGNSPPHNVIIRPPTGQEWNGIDLAPTNRLLVGRLGFRASGSKQFDIQNLYMELDGQGSWISLVNTSWQACVPIFTLCGIRYIGAGTNYYGIDGTVESPIALDNCDIINIPLDVLLTDYITANHCAFVDCCGSGGTLVTTAKAPVINNSLSINCGDDGGSATGDYNASDSDPTNVPGGNSVAATTADLVDYAGGDYRTKASSSLATAGSGGTFIGAFLEESGGATLTADSGSYSYTGIAVSLQTSRKIAVNSGTFSFSGNSLSLIRSVKLTADSGSHSYAGTDVALTYTPSGATYNLAIDQGSFTCTGTAVHLAAQRNISADSGSFSYTGAGISFTYQRTLAAGSGSYSYSGTNISLVAFRALAASNGIYSYNGTNISLSLPSELWAAQSNVATSWADRANETTEWIQQINVSTTWTEE